MHAINTCFILALWNILIEDFVPQHANKGPIEKEKRYERDFAPMWAQSLIRNTTYHSEAFPLASGENQYTKESGSLRYLSEAKPLRNKDKRNEVARKGNTSRSSE